MAEQESTAKPSTGKTVRAPAQLGWFARILAFLSGVGILGAGVYAVFTVERDWGPVALIVIGAMLLLAALFGRLPYVKWGDKEFDMGTARTLVEALESPPEERAEILGELAENVPPSLAPEVRKLAAQAEVMNLVRGSLPRHVSVSDGVGSGYQRSDATLIDSTGRKAVLYVRGIGSRDERARLRTALDDFKAMDEMIVGGLIIERQVIPSMSRYELRNAGFVLFRLPNGWQEAEKLEGLTRAIEEAFTPALEDAPQS